MRKARNWWAGEFFPQSADDFLKVAWAMGTQENAWLRQVGGYWGIVASFVLQGVLNEELFLQPGFSGEMFSDLRQDPSLRERTAREAERPEAFLNHREGGHPHQVGQQSPAVHDQARRNDAPEAGGEEGQLVSPRFCSWSHPDRSRSSGDRRRILTRGQVRPVRPITSARYRICYPNRLCG